MRITRLLITASAVFFMYAGPASAQAMFSASIGNVFGGDAPSTRRTWAVAIGGGGAHGIGSELEFSEPRNFFLAADGVAHGKVLTLMPSIFLAVPISKVRPYGIIGFGFIRQRTAASTGGIFSGLSDDDIGYNIGGGVTYQFARRAGVRGDLRHFKVRKANGISFRRLMVGIVLGG